MTELLIISTDKVFKKLVIPDLKRQVGNDFIFLFYSGLHHILPVIVPSLMAVCHSYLRLIHKFYNFSCFIQMAAKNKSQAICYHMLMISLHLPLYIQKNFLLSAIYNAVLIECYFHLVTLYLFFQFMVTSESVPRYRKSDYLLLLLLLLP